MLIFELSTTINLILFVFTLSVCFYEALTLQFHLFPMTCLGGSQMC